MVLVHDEHETLTEPEQVCSPTFPNIEGADQF